MKKFKIAIAIILIAIFITGCIKTPTGYVVKEPDTIKIGFVGPLTGFLAASGVAVKEAFELAHQQNPIVNGKRIEIIYADGRADPIAALKAAQKLINIDKVNIVVSGVASSSTLAIAPVAEQHNKLLISPVSQAPAISQAGDNVFRISPSSTPMAENIAKKLYEIGIRKLGIIFSLNPYPEGVKTSIKTQFEKLGGKVVAIESFNVGDTDLKTQLLKVNAKQPEAIYFAVISPVSATALLQQAKELNINTQLAGDFLYQWTIVRDKRKAEMEGMYVGDYDYNINSPEIQKFLTEFNAFHNHKVTETTYSLLGYDLYQVLYDALETCNNDNVECIKQFLYSVEDRPALSGTYSIDKNGDAVRKMALKKAVNGQLIVV